MNGLNAQLAVLSTPLAAPVITGSRLCRGNAASGNGAAKLFAGALATARSAGVSGRVLVRADSAYYRHDLIHAAIRAGAWFSVTARQDAKVSAAITAIDESAWATINYPNAVFDQQLGGWISTAQVAETSYTAFTSLGKGKQVTARLVVRRVKDLNQKVADNGQDQLFPTYRHHAFFTNSTLDTVDADDAHRDHAIIEQVIAELKDGPLAHAPSGKFTANSAWLALAATAFNLARAAGVLASARHGKARWATLRRHLINVPARLASSARSLTIHLPRYWPWAQPWQALFTAANGPPAALPAS